MGVNGIYGLSGSGLDIESMVKVGMMSKQSQYDKMYKTETKMSWQKEAYSTVYTDLTNFGMNKLTDYKLQSKMNAMAATSNNTSAFTVSANGSAVAMSHKVEVNELSSNAYLISTKAITRTVTGASSDSIALKDSMFETFKEVSSEDAEGEAGNKITTYEVDGKTVNGSDVAFQLVVNDGKSELKEEARTIKFTYDDLANGKTFNDLASSIKNLGLNVTASYDSVNDSFSLYNSKGGSENTISLTMGTAGTAHLFNNLHLGESRNGELTGLQLQGSKAEPITSSGAIAYANESASGSNALKDIVFSSIEAADPSFEVQGFEGIFASKEVHSTDGNSTIYALKKEDGSVGAYVKATTDGENTTYQTAKAVATTNEGVTSYSPADEWTDVAADPVTELKAYNIKKTADGESARVLGRDTALTFTLNDGMSTKTVSLTYASLAEGKTLGGLADDINSKGLNITASYENGAFSFANKEVAEENKISITMGDNTAATLFNNLKLGENLASGSAITSLGSGFFKYDENASSQTASTISGSNGKITVDGRAYTNITDNRITVAGVTYTLLDKTSSAATVTVTQDTDAIVDRVKQFVEDYNSMLDDLQKKYTETKYSDYDVLTKSQEEAMTKEQVEKWNEKAKSGLLYHDKYIGDIISKMREALSTPVEGVSGKYNSAFNIGIRTSTDQGHIELDEDKLKTVLNAEPNSVYEVFGKLGAYDEKTKKYDYKASGVAQRLGDVINDGMKSIKSYAGTSTEADDGSTLGTKIMEWQNKMSDFKTKMSAFESLLYKKYDAMEVALQRLAMTLNYVSFNNG